MHPTVKLACDLIKRPSVTPDDAQCQALISNRLKGSGFHIEHLPYDGVSNLWASHGTGSPVFAFAGHTDVVPPGDTDQWHFKPFSAHIDNEVIFGRGATDMKGAVAAMCHALELFVDQHPHHPGTVALLLTSDEEGPAVSGIRKVMETFSGSGRGIDYCLLGEPSSHEQLGDTIKVGRRGSISGTLVIQGKEGHIAYPHLADNPIHHLGQVINQLSAETWDSGNAFFPPTSFQFSNVKAGDGTGNVIPGQATLTFNFRYSSALDETTIMHKTQQILDRLPISYDLKWQAFGKPFITESGKLIESTREVIKTFTGLDTTLSTSGGTSDGRFIAPTGAEVVELGPINASMHKFNEHVSVRDLIDLTDIYLQICKAVVCPSSNQSLTKEEQIQTHEHKTGEK